MEIRYYIDTDTGLPHIYGHGVLEDEVENILKASLEDRPAKDDSRAALGQTPDGRYLRVIYVPDEDGEGIFVITAYALSKKEVSALKRRQRRKQKNG